jgi:hypothetical protein
MKTTKLILILTLLTISPQLVNSQFFVELNTGYAAPLNFESPWHVSSYKYFDNMKDVDTSFYVFNKFNMGNGLFLNGEFGYHLKNNLEFSINTYYLNNNKFDVFYNSYTREIVRESNQYFEDDTTYAFSFFDKKYSYYGKLLSFSPMLSYSFEINKFCIQPSLGLSLSYIALYRNITLNSQSIDSCIYFVNKRVIKEERRELFKKNNHLGANVAISTFYKLNQRLELKFRIEGKLFLDNMIVDGIQYYYSHLYKLNDKEIINVEDETKVSSVEDDYYNFNTVNFSLGIRYYFNDKTISNKN